MTLTSLLLRLARPGLVTAALAATAAVTTATARQNAFSAYLAAINYAQWLAEGGGEDSP